MPVTGDTWRRWQKLAILVPSFAFAIILLWYNYQGDGQFQHPGLTQRIHTALADYSICNRDYRATGWDGQRPLRGMAPIGRLR